MNLIPAVITGVDPLMVRSVGADSSAPATALLDVTPHVGAEVVTVPHRGGLLVIGAVADANYSEGVPAHGHDEYAPLTHTHSYSDPNHTHAGYASATHSHDYASSTHTHDYAATSHTHNYAAASHDHPSNNVRLIGVERYRSTSQPVAAGTWTSIAFNATVRAHGLSTSYYSSVGWVRALYTGWYLASVEITPSGEINGSRYITRFYNSSDGSYPARDEHWPYTASPVFVTTAPVFMTAGQYLYVQSYSTVAFSIVGAVLDFIFLGEGY